MGLDIIKSVPQEIYLVLIHVAQLTGRCPAKSQVRGLIPGQDTRPGFGFVPSRSQPAQEAKD